MLDTGAISGSFISTKTFAAISKYVSHRVTPCSVEVGLADSDTIMTAHNVVSLSLVLYDDRRMAHDFELEMYVLDIPEGEIIIGLPDILTSFWTYSLALWESRRVEYLQNLKNIHSKKHSFDHEIASQEEGSDRNTVDASTTVPGTENEVLVHESDMNDEAVTAYLNVLYESYSIFKDESSPEELESYEPCSHTQILEFLGKTHPEAVAEFISLFDDHISKGFRDATKVEELMKSKGAQVFVPEQWTGITGVDPIRLKFKDTFPDRIKPAARHINPRLYGNAHKEFLRLLGYFYRSSRSNWASPLVIAAKATAPFIRFCGDYVTVNKHIATGHFQIPRVRNELDRIIGYECYIDLDMTNAYHQLRLHPETSERLSVQTPWGQYEPLFMPEGIGPGSSLLQETVVKLFGDIEWMIVIFDNMLILAKSYQDAYEKLEIVLDICIKHGVMLKMKKSFLGFDTVNFFGYLCKKNSYELTEDRKKAILDIKFPEGKNQAKLMRTAVGMGVFFAPFVKNYSSHLQHLTDLTKDSASWDESAWKFDYRKEFNDYKTALQSACAIYYPDYSLDWVIRTDASEYGMGGVLIQKAYDKLLQRIVEQIIALVSHKFSGAALRWDTIEKEAFAIYYTVKKLSYYLIGKEFVIETDHANLAWIQKSEVAKIIRWRVFLQSFMAIIKHIPGCKNILPDALSRLFKIYERYDPWEKYIRQPIEDYEMCLNMLYENQPKDTNTVELSPEVVDIPTHEELLLTREQMFLEVHPVQNGPFKGGHWGVKNTWRRLNQQFPGHGISQLEVSNLVDACVNCQKTRQRFTQELVPITRSLKPPDAHTVIGIDELTITPHGKNGETHLVAIVNLFTKHIALYPVKTIDALSLCQSVWSYWCAFRRTDMILSDLGPALNSDLFEQLRKLAGITHKFSIVDRHKNGVERSLREVQRHLRAIVYDTRVTDIFDNPVVVPTVSYVMNENQSAETGYISPFDLTFGPSDRLRQSILSSSPKVEVTHKFLKQLTIVLTNVRQVSQEFQSKLDEKRGVDSVSPNVQNRYCKGDLVMHYPGPKPSPKLSARFRGPFIVLSHYKNDVEIKDVLTEAIQKRSSATLQPFFGSLDQAKEAAMRDKEQFVVKRIISHQGNSKKRTLMTFKVEFEDGDLVNIPWTHDLECQAFDEYCNSLPFLEHLTRDAMSAAKWISQLNRQPIISVQPGDLVWVDLRYFGDLWFESLFLPNPDTVRYVVRFEYVRWYHKTSRSAIVAQFLLGVKKHNFFTLTSYDVYAWGGVKEIKETSGIVKVDAAFVQRFPQVVHKD